MEDSMKQHSGMRPQDILVLLKIIALADTPWRITDIANALNISQSEISESLNRNRIAGFVDDSKRQVHKAALLEFLLHGLKYVFPEQPGPIVKGMPTAHSAPPLSSKIVATAEPFVWPDPEGTLRGQSIRPLYNTVPDAARSDPKLYELLALVDAIRVGRARERRLAESELGKRLALT
jgi:hypothetical protein